MVIVVDAGNRTQILLAGSDDFDHYAHHPEVVRQEYSVMAEQSRDQPWSALLRNVEIVDQTKSSTLMVLKLCELTLFRAIHEYWAEYMELAELLMHWAPIPVSRLRCSTRSSSMMQVIHNW